MTIKQAIARADALRPNALAEERKADWAEELEGRLALVMGTEVPARRWPQDRTLTMPAPYDSVYELYLCAMIDWANQETGLYANDMALFNAAWNAALAWWRREHDPDRGQSWRGL